MTSDDLTAEEKAAGKRERTKALNRQAILEAAREVFAEMGYGATTVRDIIRRTGLASGTFYNYFKSKEEVFEALNDHAALELRPHLIAVRREANSLEDFVRRMFRTYFDYVAKNRKNFAMARANAGQMRVRMDSPEVVAGFEELRADLADAMARGIVPPVDLDFLTAAIVGTAFEIADRMLARDPADPDAAAEFAAALFLGGLTLVPRTG